MKNTLIVIFLFILSNLTLVSQSIVALEKSIKIFKPNFGAASNNYWFGSTTMFQVTNKSEFANNILPTARGKFEIVTFEIKTKDSNDSIDLVFPTVFNVGVLRDLISNGDSPDEEAEEKLNEILNSQQGIHIGLNPYAEIYQTANEKFSVTTHCYIGAKVNSFKLKDESIKYLFQGRFSIGVDFKLGKNYPAVVSFEQVFTTFNKTDYKEIFGEEKSNANHLYGELILPIANSIGGVLNFHYNKNAGFVPSLGFIFTTK